MEIVVFYVQDLSEVSSKFEEKTGKKFNSYCSDILIENKLPYDGWYVRCIY